jgi:hypothetical protein
MVTADQSEYLVEPWKLKNFIMVSLVLKTPDHRNSSLAKSKFLPGVESYFKALAQRKPTLLSRPLGWKKWRSAQRESSAGLYHDPPLTAIVF